MLPAFQDGSQDETLDNSDLNLSESRDTGQHSGGQSGGDPLDGLDGKWSNSVFLSLPLTRLIPVGLTDCATQHVCHAFLKMLHRHSCGSRIDSSFTNRQCLWLLCMRS